MREKLRALAAAGKNAVLDATHVSRRRRERMIRFGRSLGYERVAGLWFNTPFQECARRNRARPNPVPDFVVYKLNNDLQRQPPSRDEGFDELKEVRES
jgi:predicted kinase